MSLMTMGIPAPGLGAGAQTIAATPQTTGSGNAVEVREFMTAILPRNVRASTLVLLLRPTPTVLLNLQMEAPTKLLMLVLHD